MSKHECTLEFRVEIFLTLAFIASSYPIRISEVSGKIQKRKSGVKHVKKISSLFSRLRLPVQSELWFLDTWHLLDLWDLRSSSLKEANTRLMETIVLWLTHHHLIREIVGKSPFPHSLWCTIGLSNTATHCTFWLWLAKAQGFFLILLTFNVL